MLASSRALLIALAPRSYYDAFVSISRGLFNSRSRAEHSRKRKLVSNTFSPKSVVSFEPHVHRHLRLFVRQLDSLVEQSKLRNGAGRKEAHVDCLPWFHYLAFDIIGYLAFDTPFGMLAAGADRVETRVSPESPPGYVSAVSTINRRGQVAATLGCYPALIPYARWMPDPFFSRGLDAIGKLAGVAVARVRARLESPPDEQPKDLLSRLLKGRDDNVQPLARDELTAEVLTQLIAGSDTTSNTCALMYYLACHPSTLHRLQAHLDVALSEVDELPTYDAVKDVDYLGWVINETMRLHSTSGLGLPREIPPNSPGVTILGRHFPAGTVLSVPTYTIHRSKEIWGPDADDFRPERWEKPTPRQKNAFVPFSIGPRACVGRNVAEMELRLIAATWARRYSVELRQGPLVTREGFLNKPLELHVAISRR